MVIIFDSSESIGKDKFEKIKSKISEFVSTLHENIKVGIVRYSSIVHTISPLVDSSQRLKLIERINGMEYTGGTTATYAGLLRAKTLFSNYSSYKSCVGHQKQTIVLVTDGLSNNMMLSIQTAHEMKKLFEICILAIGNNIHTYQLGEIASSPTSIYLHHIKDIDDFTKVSTVLSSIRSLLVYSKSEF